MKKIKCVALILVLAIIICSSPVVLCVSATTPRSVVVYETNGENGDFAYAQQAYANQQIYGYISSQYDMDFYRVTSPIAGNVSFRIKTEAENCEYCLEVYWDEEYDYYPFISLVAYDGEAETTALGYAGVGVTYYLHVRSNQGYSTTVPYEIEMIVEPQSYIYYAQTAPTQTTDYVLNFNKIYDADRHTASGWQTWHWYKNLANYGCYACSYAMVLNNLGERTEIAIPNVMAAVGANIPVQYMDAQPYTILWANTTPIGNAYTLNSIGTTFTYNSEEDVYYTAPDAYDMCYTDRRAISTLFDVVIIKYNVSGESASNKKDILVNLLSENPEGVIAVFNNSSSGYHAIVFTDTTLLAESVNCEQYISTITTKHGSYDSLEDLQAYHENTGEIETVSLYSYEADYKDEKGTYNDNYVAMSRSTTEVFSDGDEFTIYDPGRYTNSDGDRVYCEAVSLNETYTANHYSGWGDLVEFIVIESACCSD